MFPEIFLDVHDKWIHQIIYPIINEIRMKSRKKKQYFYSKYLINFYIIRRNSLKGDFQKIHIVKCANISSHQNFSSKSG